MNKLVKKLKIKGDQIKFILSGYSLDYVIKSLFVCLVEILISFIFFYLLDTPIFLIILYTILLIWAFQGLQEFVLFWEYRSFIFRKKTFNQLINLMNTMNFEFLIINPNQKIKYKHKFKVGRMLCLHINKLISIDSLNIEVDELKNDFAAKKIKKSLISKLEVSTNVKDSEDDINKCPGLKLLVNNNFLVMFNTIIPWCVIEEVNIKHSWNGYYKFYITTKYNGEVKTTYLAKSRSNKMFLILKDFINHTIKYKDNFYISDDNIIQIISQEENSYDVDIKYLEEKLS